MMKSLFLTAVIHGLLALVVSQDRWCCISQEEWHKCIDLYRTRKFPFTCVRGTGVDNCVEKIMNHEADIITLDAGDIYTHKDQLIVAAAEDYGLGEGEPGYYAVAVAKKSGAGPKRFAIDELRAQISCHTGVGKTSGWIMPMGHLQKMGTDPYTLFKSSCAPGANSPSYAKFLHGTNPTRWCEQCLGDNTGAHICERSHDERFYGYEGALKCLIYNAGTVAFMKHSTVPKFAAENPSFDKTAYGLLCPNSQMMPIDDWRQCNLGRVPPHAVVIRKTLGEKVAQNLLLALKKSMKYIPSRQFLYGPNLLWKSSISGFQAPTSTNPEDFLGQEYICSYKNVEMGQMMC